MTTCQQFEEARRIRFDTLESVEHLCQEGADACPRPGAWSAGEVLDHLIKVDRLIIRELDVTFQQRRRGIPFTYRSVADVDTSIPWMARPLLPFFEIPFSFFNAVIPLSVRNALTGNRRLRVQAPAVLRPRRGRPLAELRRELEGAFDHMACQQLEEAHCDVQRTYYYNAFTGLNSIAELYRFISNHERRHQQQLSDILRAQPAPQRTPYASPSAGFFAQGH